jgi:GntR family transcriptional repressor for pyruvate dehydrogenase complex
MSGADSKSAQYAPARRPRPKVTDEIIETLRQDIASGALARGKRLPNERDLAKQFGVSQPTIREAVRALDTMGLIDVRHGSGAYVTGDGWKFFATSLDTLLQIERVGIIEVIDVRAVLGLNTARRAAEHATDAQLENIARLARALEEIKAEKDINRIIEAVIEFQVAIAAAAHNPLQFAIESFLIHLLMKFQLTAKSRAGIRFWRSWTLQFTEDRRQLVEAITARDQQASVDAMETYLENQRALFSSDREIARLRLTDRASVEAIAMVTLEMPSVEAIDA